MENIKSLLNIIYVSLWISFGIVAIWAMLANPTDGYLLKYIAGFLLVVITIFKTKSRNA